MLNEEEVRRTERVLNGCERSGKVTKLEGAYQCSDESIHPNETEAWVHEVELGIKKALHVKKLAELDSVETAFVVKHHGVLRLLLNELWNAAGDNVDQVTCRVGDRATSNGIRPGMVVKFDTLRNKGEMTASGACPIGRIPCIWFSDDKEVHRNCFDPSELIVISDKGDT